MSAEEPFVSARGIARRFGVQVALYPCDLDVQPAESLALVGPNGAGKSTLLSILAGALEPSAGVVERRDGVRVGWVPQRPAYYDRLTARENLELFARLEGERRPADAASRVLEQFDIPPDRAAATLSVGNRQRLNVAVAWSRCCRKTSSVALNSATSACNSRSRSSKSFTCATSPLRLFNPSSSCAAKRFAS